MGERDLGGRVKGLARRATEISLVTLIATACVSTRISPEQTYKYRIDVSFNDDNRRGPYVLRLYSNKEPQIEINGQMKILTAKDVICPIQNIPTIALQENLAEARHNVGCVDFTPLYRVVTSGTISVIENPISNR